MTPLPDDGPVFDQHQSGIASDDGLQRRFVCLAERILSPRQVHPPSDGLLRACRQAIEWYLLFLGIFIQLVNLTEIAVVCMFQMGRDQQEGISFLRQHLLCDVFPCLVQLDREVVDWRYISLLCLNGLAIYKLPGRVRVVFKRELFLHPVFL